ncbi:hypothetical protein GCM10023205_45580 [Yinghuangia aomiensis]|uniref:HEAT repeat-containing protein n=1 Tax=Yinghuangia aomiensis TaxID=676205 RepID=A0ABP9HME0_9ACTN
MATFRDGSSTTATDIRDLAPTTPVPASANRGTGNPTAPPQRDIHHRPRTADVDWPSLAHAYGPADDMPGLLAALRVPDAAARRRARRRLAGSVFHQGDRYSATAPTIPHLIAAADDPGTPDRERILRLVALLAVGYDDAHIPGGFDAVGLRAEAARIAARDVGEARLAMAAWVADAPNDDIRANRAYLLDVRDFAAERDQAAWALRCYDEALAGAPAYRRLLRDPDPSVRTAAAYLLGWFPEDAAATIPLLAARAAADPDGTAAATAALAASLLGGGTAVAPWAVRTLADTAAADREDPATRPTATRAAALALTLSAPPRPDETTQRAAAILTDLLTLPGAEDAPGPRDEVPRLPYLDGDWSALAAAVLGRPDS